jgi:xanthomonalisin
MERNRAAIVSALGMAPGLSQVLVYECCSDTYDGSPSGAVVILNRMVTDNIAKQLSCSYGYGTDRGSGIGAIFSQYSTQSTRWNAANLQPSFGSYRRSSL